ncbi:hypothetical protein [Moritella sp. Urea-trap-13]|nr:hypothetical protein [Moritella sp. Urea-trap-13]
MILRAFFCLLFNAGYVDVDVAGDELLIAAVQPIWHHNMRAMSD